MTSRPVLTKGGEHFVTPMALGALAKSEVHTSLWDLKDEIEMGHIELSRSADFVLVCPATADLLAKMAAGIADDLATTLLLATDKKVVVAPAMNVRMWQHPATERNVAQLKVDGVTVIDPDEGEMACGEFGPGRLPEPDAIVDCLTEHGVPRREVSARRQAHPGHRRPDPRADRPGARDRQPLVGRQGFAIAAAAADAGARVTLVAGPVSLDTPPGVDRVDVETAEQMADAVMAALPADCAIMVAAVADWRVEPSPTKLKKGERSAKAEVRRRPATFSPKSRPDAQRPRLVVGFAAETDRVVENAIAKRVAQRAPTGSSPTTCPATSWAAIATAVHLITADGIEDWPEGSKTEVARTANRKDRNRSAIRPGNRRTPVEQAPFGWRKAIVSSEGGRK